MGREKLRPINELLSDEVEWFTIRAVLEKHRENCRERIMKVYNCDFMLKLCLF